MWASFNLSVGTRVILIRNIFTSKGLVNGALGYIVNFVKNNVEIQEIYMLSKPQFREFNFN